MDQGYPGRVRVAVGGSAGTSTTLKRASGGALSHQRRGQGGPALARDARLADDLQGHMVCPGAEMRSCDAGELVRRPVRDDGIDQAIGAPAGDVLLAEA